MQEFESFEVTEYSKNPEVPGRVQGVIREIIAELRKSSPAMGVVVSFTGNLARIAYNSYEMHLPRRMKIVEDAAKQVLNETAKYVKKQYKEKTGETVNLKEVKDLANFSTQKVSLNERYVYTSWRYYEVE